MSSLKKDSKDVLWSEDSKDPSEIFW